MSFLTHYDEMLNRRVTRVRGKKSKGRRVNWGWLLETDFPLFAAQSQPRRSFDWNLDPSKLGASLRNQVRNRSFETHIPTPPAMPYVTSAMLDGRHANTKPCYMTNRQAQEQFVRVKRSRDSSRRQSNAAMHSACCVRGANR